MSSSGLVPMPFAKRVRNEYCVSERTWLSVLHRAGSLLEVALPNDGSFPIHSRLHGSLSQPRREIRLILCFLVRDA